MTKEIPPRGHQPVRHTLRKNNPLNTDLSWDDLLFDKPHKSRLQ